jgi:hypothetical protein
LPLGGVRCSEYKEQQPPVSIWVPLKL